MKIIKTCNFLKNIELNEERIPDERLAYTENINNEIDKVYTIIKSSYDIMKESFND